MTMYFSMTVKEHKAWLAEFWKQKQEEAERRQAVSDAKTDSREVTVIGRDGMKSSRPAFTRGKLRKIEKRTDAELHRSGRVDGIDPAAGIRSCCTDCTDSMLAEEWSEISANRVSIGAAGVDPASPV